VIAESEGAAAFLPEYVNANALLATTLKERVENVLQITRENSGSLCSGGFVPAGADGMFGPKLDVILTPSAKGEAPEGLHRPAMPSSQDVDIDAWPNVGIPVCFGPTGSAGRLTLSGRKWGIRACWRSLRRARR